MISVEIRRVNYLRIVKYLTLSFILASESCRLEISVFIDEAD